jgi:predicted dehydrogenase
MNKYKMVIIGATGSAYKRTMPGLKNSQICEVVAIQGRSLEKLQKISQEYAIPKIYLNAKEMLDKEHFDVIFIGTPPYMHFENISLASKYGKPIISEKPLASSLDDVEKISKILKSSGGKFMLAHHLRHQKQ